MQGISENLDLALPATKKNTLISWRRRMRRLERKNSKFYFEVFSSAKNFFLLGEAKFWSYSVTYKTSPLQRNSFTTFSNSMVNLSYSGPAILTNLSKKNT